MYNTGDIVKIDTDGYLFILGRLKRFAKIAGEMISLSQVEVFPKKIWPENNSAICSIKDSKKGESLILLTDNKNADLKIVHELMKSEGLSNLYFPKEMKIIDEFPILGSGKIDFRKLQEIAES
jgi:acyl-[acyl-carrier-protein]-phospholipid O-acyltransferase/long-chain-fatty-acid--[acyl-carrier-protein] ligase